MKGKILHRVLSINLLCLGRLKVVSGSIKPYRFIM